MKPFTWIIVGILSCTLNDAHTQCSIGIFYAPALSKTFFLENEINNPNINYFKKNADPDRPFRGRSFGVYSNIELNRWTFNVSLSDNLRGQQSEIFHLSDSSYFNNIGRFYECAYWSNSVSCNIGYTIFEKSEFHAGFMGGGGLDLYRKFIFHDKGISDYTGTFGGSVLSLGHNYQESDHYFYNLQESLKNHLYRLTLSLALFGELKLSNHFTLVIKPEIHYCTRLSSRARYFAYFNDIIYAGDIQVGLAWKFKKRTQK